MTCESIHQMSISHQHGSGYRRQCARDRCHQGGSTHQSRFCHIGSRSLSAAAFLPLLLLLLVLLLAAMMGLWYKTVGRA